MAVLAAGVEADSFGFAVGSAYTTSLSSVYRDSLYSNSAIGANVGGPIYRFDFGTGPATFWFHACFYMDGTLSTTATGEILRFDSGTGPELRLVGTGANGVPATAVEVQWEKTTNGTTWTAVGSAFNLIAAAFYTIDLSVTLGVSGSLKCWLSAAPVVDFTGDVSTQTNTATFARLGAHTTGVVTYWTQVILADEPTIGMRLQTLAPNSSGTYLDWLGAYTTIDEADYSESDSMSTNVSGRRTSWNIANTSASLLNNNVIKALCQSMRGLNQIGSNPPDINFFLRTNSTDYNSGGLGWTTDGVRRSSHRVLTTSPNTGVAWTASNIDAVQLGVRAA